MKGVMTYRYRPVQYKRQRRGRQQRIIYQLDIHDVKERFRQHHRDYAKQGNTDAEVEAYIDSLFENALAHFDNEKSAVQDFISHFLKLITEGVSSRYKFHPLKHLDVLRDHEYEDYMYFLAGFATDLFELLQEHRMYRDGELVASYDSIRGSTLHLMIRPKVPDVFTFEPPKP